MVKLTISSSSSSSAKSSNFLLLKCLAFTGVAKRLSWSAYISTRYKIRAINFSWEQKKKKKLAHIVLTMFDLLFLRLQESFPIAFLRWQKHLSKFSITFELLKKCESLVCSLSCSNWLFRLFMLESISMNSRSVACSRHESKWWCCSSNELSILLSEFIFCMPNMEYSSRFFLAAMNALLVAFLAQRIRASLVFCYIFFNIYSSVEKKNSKTNWLV